MPKLKMTDMNMVYRIDGRGDPVVLIHGLGGDHTSFDDPLRPALLRRFRVLTMDLRGHGRSSHTRRLYTTALFADDVKRLLDKLNISNARVLGTSMGGAVAMILAARHPALVQRLVLVDTWARCDEAARACFPTGTVTFLPRKKVHPPWRADCPPLPAGREDHPGRFSTEQDLP